MSDIKWYCLIVTVLMFLAALTIVATAGTEKNGFYKDKMVPGTQMPCCTKKDCVPLSAWRQDTAGAYWIYLPHGYWYKPEANIVRVEYTPDGRAHACYHEKKRMNYEAVKVVVFCVWIPVPIT